MVDSVPSKRTGRTCKQQARIPVSPRNRIGVEAGNFTLVGNDISALTPTCFPPISEFTDVTDSSCSLAPPAVKLVVRAGTALPLWSMTPSIKRW